LRRIILGAGSRGKEAERKVQTDAEILFKGPGPPHNPEKGRALGWLHGCGPTKKKALPKQSQNLPATSPQKLMSATT
jgi:hypothetical protein